VRGVTVLGDGEGDRGLVVARGGEPHVERRRGPGGGSAVRGDHERAVDAPAQQGRDRHVGDGLPADRPEQGALRLRGRFVEPAGAVGNGCHIVVMEPARPRGVDRQDRTLGQRVHVGEPGGGLGHVAQTEKVVARLTVDLRAEPRQGEDRLHLAGEHPLALVDHREPDPGALEPDPQRVAHRGRGGHLPGRLGQLVPREAQRAPAAVVDGEGENAAEPFGHASAVVLVEVHQHLCVRGTAELMPAGLQLGPQVAMVVDLAVVDDGDRAILVAHGLVPRG